MASQMDTGDQEIRDVLAKANQDAIELVVDATTNGSAARFKYHQAEHHDPSRPRDVVRRARSARPRGNGSTRRRNDDYRSRRGPRPALVGLGSKSRRQLEPAGLSKT